MRGLVVEVPSLPGGVWLLSLTLVGSGPGGTTPGTRTREKNKQDSNFRGQINKSDRLFPKLSTAYMSSLPISNPVCQQKGQEGLLPTTGLSSNTWLHKIYTLESLSCSGCHCISSSSGSLMEATTQLTLSKLTRRTGPPIWLIRTRADKVRSPGKAEVSAASIVHSTSITTWKEQTIF